MPSIVDCLRPRHSVRVLVSTIVGRLPEGMGPLVVAVFLRSRGLDFATVGGLTAAYGVSAAAGTPVLARAVDRLGQARILLCCAVLSAAGFLLLSAAQPGALLPAVLGVVLAGGMTPPLEPSLRSLWPDLLGTGPALRAAYALDAALQQMVFVVGPLLVVVLLGAGEAVLALGVTALLTIVGTAVYATAPPVRRWRAPASTAGFRGPWRSATLRRVVAGFVFVGLTLGALNINAVAYAESLAQPAFSGVMLGVNAAGALVGGLVYGARRWPGGPEAHLRVALLGLTVGYAPLALVPGPVPALVVTALGGLFLAPSLAAAFALVGRDAPEGTSTESFGWLVTVVLVGNALGSSTAGGLVEHAGPGAVGWLPAVGGLAALLLLLPRLPLVRPTVETTTHR